jgi:ribonucleoside-diphosphate reductase alpha chain
VIAAELKSQGIHSHAASLSRGVELGLITAQAAQIASAIRFDDSRDDLYEFFGLKTVYDRYLLRHPETRKVIESPQSFIGRVGAGLSRSTAEAQSFYDVVSRFDFMPSTPTLFNSGTRIPQLSSCFLLDSPEDSLTSIYARYAEVAELSKFSGGIGIAYHRVRSRGSLIKGTNGKSSGVVPWLKTLDSSVAAVNQGGRRKGACCVYLETWHADIEEFLELRNNTGDEARRTHNLNLAHWVPDLFMERVEQGGSWSLFDPRIVPHLTDLYGDEFRLAYEAAERDLLYSRQVAARDLYARMMKTLAETGQGWMCFKDSSNRKSNQTGRPGNVVHLSNLCTEILEVTSKDETAVCNLGSVNLAHHVVDGKFDFAKLGRTVATLVPYLDRVIDLNYYGSEAARRSNRRWRPIGIGVMGLQDVFFALRLRFDSEEARELSARIQEQCYFSALEASHRLSVELGPHPSFEETRAAQGQLQFDLWGVKPGSHHDWSGLREKIRQQGLRNSLLLAIAPTATIASIVGCFESIEPQVSNLFKRETMSGEFLQINRFLVRDLQARKLWDDSMLDELKKSEGSVQGIARVPEDLRALYRTAWELSMRSLIDLAAARGSFLDQSQSLNLFVESPTIGKLSSMYAYAWKKGIKTTYYLRSRPATRIAKATVSTPAAKAATPSDAVSCSLENPESCEACQ